MNLSSQPQKHPLAAAVLNLEWTALLASLLLCFVGSAHAQRHSNLKAHRHPEMTIDLQCHRSTWPTTPSELACNLMRIFAAPHIPE